MLGWQHILQAEQRQLSELRSWSGSTARSRPTRLASVASPQDVREYMLDLLWAHAGVQRFNVTPSAAAAPLTHRALLDHFLYDVDRDMILKQYPWLRCGPEGDEVSSAAGSIVTTVGGGAKNDTVSEAGAGTGSVPKDAKRD